MAVDRVEYRPGRMGGRAGVLVVFGEMLRGVETSGRCRREEGGGGGGEEGEGGGEGKRGERGRRGEERELI